MPPRKQSAKRNNSIIFFNVKSVINAEVNTRSYLWNQRRNLWAGVEWGRGFHTVRDMRPPTAAQTLTKWRRAERRKRGVPRRSRGQVVRKLPAQPLSCGGENTDLTRLDVHNLLWRTNLAPPHSTSIRKTSVALEQTYCVDLKECYTTSNLVCYR